MSAPNLQFFERLIELLSAKPFQPFRIRTSDGRAYFVDAPQYVARSRSGDVITYFTPEDDRAVTLRIAHIVSIEASGRPAA